MQDRCTIPADHDDKRALAAPVHSTPGLSSALTEIFSFVIFLNLLFEGIKDVLYQRFYHPDFRRDRLRYIGHIVLLRFKFTSYSTTELPPKWKTQQFRDSSLY